MQVNGRIFFLIKSYHVCYYFIQAERTNIDNFIYTCIGPRTIIWLAISYAYKGLLQLVAMFMAFHIRRVKIKALNDSKETAVIVYINSIILVLLAVVEFALNTYHEVYAALFGLGLMVGATLFLTLVFIPKVQPMFIMNSYFIQCSCR